MIHVSIFSTEGQLPILKYGSKQGSDQPILGHPTVSLHGSDPKRSIPTHKLGGGRGPYAMLKKDELIQPLFFF